MSRTRIRHLVISTIALGLLAMPGAAFADHVVDDPDTPPARTTAACTAAGGAFSAVPGVSRTCVVTIAGSSATVPASHPRQAWTVDVQTSEETITYTVYNTTPLTADHVHAGAETTVTACYNHRGNPIDDFEGNPNCVPAAA